MVSSNASVSSTPGNKRRKPRILIAGIGNELLQDDGVGVHAIRELIKNPPSGVVCVEVGTAVLDALHLIEWADKILVIDAMQAHGAPGTIYLSDVREMQGTKVGASLHELSFLNVLRFLPPGSKMPQISVMGIEPESIDYGLELSPAVRAALPKIMPAITDMVESWGNSGG
jgi:hydrogenase maturation protease